MSRDGETRGILPLIPGKGRGQRELQQRNSRCILVPSPSGSVFHPPGASVGVSGVPLVAVEAVQGGAEDGRVEPGTQKKSLNFGRDKHDMNWTQKLSF